MVRTVKQPKAQPPKGIELDYLRQIIQLYNPWFRDFRDTVLGFYPNITFDNVIKIDSVNNKFDDIFADFLANWKIKVTGFVASIRTVGQQVQNFSFRQTSKQVKAVAGIDITEGNLFLQNELNGWAKDNADLITNMGTATKNRISQIVQQGQANGLSTVNIRNQIQDVAGIEKRRAAIIARDQVGKLNGQLTKSRQTSLGIDSYIWQTAGDKRVRDTHKELEGKTFTWTGRNHAPNGIIPGSEINCRCAALPVFDESFFSDINIDMPNIV